LSIASKVIKNTSFVFISTLFNRLFSLLFIVYAARMLGPGDLGIYALIGAVVSIFFSFVNFGIGPMAVRELARDKTKITAMFNDILSLRLSLVVMTYPLLALVVNILGYSEEVRYLVYVAGLTAVVSTFSGSFGILYMAIERFKAPSLISILVSFLSAVSNILILYLGYGLKGIIWVPFVGSLLGAVISGIWVRRKLLKYKLSFNLSCWKELLSDSIPFAFLSFIGNVQGQMNIFFLSKLPGPIPENLAIGYYKSVSSIGNSVMIFSGSFKRAVLPTLSSNVGNLQIIKGIIDRSTKTFLILIIFPLVLATTFFNKEIIGMVFGKEYLPAATALAVMGWAYAFQILNEPITVTLSTNREMKKFIPWVLIELCVNLIFAVPLIYYYSFFGAAIAFLISKIFAIFTRNYLLRSVWGIKGLELKELSRVFVPATVIFIVLFLAYFNAVSPLSLLLLTLVLYFIFIFTSKDFHKGIAMFTNRM